MTPLDTKLIRYVFLDRDGVLNRKPPEGEYVRSWSDFVWLPGAVQAVARLNRAGVRVIVVTNQRAVALGLLTAKELTELHDQLEQDLHRHGAHLDAIYACTHDRGGCACRKPGTGLFEQAMARWPEINSGNSVVIGDSLSDIEAGKRLGMLTGFITGDPETQKPGAGDAAALADFVAPSLGAAVEECLRITDVT